MALVGWIVAQLREHPELAFFLTLAMGYLLGRIRLGSFALGSVTGVLLAGVVVGQLGIEIAPVVKQCFFLLFLFAIGYRTGPQFFRGLKSDGVPQALLTILVCCIGLLVGWLTSLLLGYDAGTAAGLLAGATTESATLGTAWDALARSPLPAAERAALQNAIPPAFAVAYLVGVIVTAWFLSQVGPRLIGVDLAAACRDYERQLSGGDMQAEPGLTSGYHRFEVRAYRVEPGSPLLGGPVRERLPALRVFVERVRHDGKLLDADGDTVLRPGDLISVSGQRAVLVESLDTRLPEVEDRELLAMPVETVNVFVTNRAVDGRTLDELSRAEGARGVFLEGIQRAGTIVPAYPRLQIERGDILRIVGAKRHVEAAVKLLGFPDRPTNATDMAFVGWGIVLGGLVGMPAVVLAGVEIGLSLSVGVLLGGLVFGWLRSVQPRFGSIPEPALWLFESVGLAGFAAVVGISAGPDFVAGLARAGVWIVVAAAAIVVIAQTCAVFVGHRVFKMHPGILLGVCAGAFTATPALAASQEQAKSSVPTLGYGVSYAVGNVLLALWGTVIVALLV